ncbi:MAG TPA: acyl--CoA ligase [Dehalococcoidia bacterium]|nr:acyl--CoA ligase [Dehalococcoidia bacterium]
MSGAEPNGTLLTVLEGGRDADPAIVVPEGPRLTYGGVRAQVRQTADFLAGLGLGRTDRVALVLPNGPEAIVLFLGAAAAATAAPLNPAYTEDEFRFYFEDTSAKSVIVPPGGAEAARAALPEGVPVIEAAIDAAGKLHLECAAPLRHGATASAPTGDDVALVLHTSGTTSRPKRVPLRHQNLAASVDNIIATYQLGPEDVSLCVMPLFHVHGLVASTLAAFGSGGTVVVPARFNPLGFWPIVRDHRATWYSAVPTIHQLLLARSRVGERPAGAESLRFIRSCSSALAPETMRLLEDRFGAPVLEAYGMTEASHQMSSNPLPPEPRLAGSVGRGTGVQIGIMDDQGTLLPTGSAGEVVIQGPNVTAGYENNPAANAEAFTKGWFRTGDLGVLDEAGYLSLLGRIKELINRGGEKIAPREIDELLQSHPAVAEAVSFGMPHPVWGEEVGVAVVLKGEATEADLVKHCRESLAEFKVPKKVFILDAIPRTATGKVQRRNVAAALGLDR